MAELSSEILETETMSKWRENPERLAWVMILSSFFIFSLLLITIPLGIQTGIHQAQMKQEARLEPILGRILLYQPGATEPVAVTNPQDNVIEGSRIVADGDSTQGILELIHIEGSDETLGSVQIYAGTILDIRRIRRPVFSRSTAPYEVQLFLEKGQARIFTTPSGNERPLEVELRTPHGRIALTPGSYTASVTGVETNLTVRSGEATLSHTKNQELKLGSGLRARMSADALSQDSALVGENLVVNGDFTQPMLNTWQSYVVAENVIPGSVRIIPRDGRRVAHLIRQGEEGVNTEVGIAQELEVDANVYDSLVLRVDVKLMHQSLSGAGYLSSEYPLRVEVKYTDIYGKELSWGRGFYYRDPENANWRIDNGEKIKPFQWYTYQSPNLLEILEDTRPARIHSLRVYASGWNYQSMVSEVDLVAQ